MPVDVVSTIEIERPRREVAAYACDPDNAPEWYENIEAVEWISPKPLALGSRIRFSARFLGRRLVYTYEVLEAEPDRRLAMAADDGPFPMRTTYVWEDAETSGTRMTLRNEGEPSGFANMARPLMERAMRRANAKDLARLKEVLEGS